MHHSRYKNFFLSSVKWIISGGMLYYVLHSIDMGEVWHMLENQSLWIPSLAILILIIQMMTSTSRWQRVIYVLSGKKLTTRYRQLVKLNFISMFFNSCLPGTIGGDVVRAMLLKRENISMTLAAHSVIIDRLMAMFGVYVMVTLSLPWLADLMPALHAKWLMPASILFMAAGLFFLAKAPKLVALLPHNHLTSLTSQLIRDMNMLVFSFREFMIVLLQAVLSHAYFCMAIYLLAASLGTPLSAFEALLLIPPVLLLVMLPVSVGGWGVREVSMVAFLGLAGVSKEAALTISVQFGLLSIVASLPGAWYYARLKRPEAL